jgi:hypothetical protein
MRAREQHYSIGKYTHDKTCEAVSASQVLRLAATAIGINNGDLAERVGDSNPLWYLALLHDNLRAFLSRDVEGGSGLASRT